jgi:flagellar basal-body rod protein FlgF
MTLRRELDIIANNVANADTAGLQGRVLLREEEPSRPAKTRLRRPVDFVIDGESRATSPGRLREPQSADVAIEGDGS